MINKIDRLPRRDALLPLIDSLTRRFRFDAVFPVCALHREELVPLLDALAAHAPARPYLFDPELVTDRPERFVAAELIREKLARQLGAELPYATHVMIERFEEREDITHIDATIWVEKPGQKAIVIGSGDNGSSRLAPRPESTSRRCSADACS